MSGVRILLRYFPVRGRAQAIRDALVDAGVDFEDLRVPLSDWRSRHRDDPVGERPRLANRKASRPERFTGRADEDRVVAQLHAVDLSSVGL
jgi:hypothetical protein